MHKKQAIVVNEQILGLLIEGEFPFVEILRSSIIRGGPMGVYTLPLITTEYRSATKKDFDDYGVLWHSDWVVTE
jgi:hypothetical protein